MTARRGAWGVYQTFDTADREQVFIGITSNGHWRRFCDAFERPDLCDDERLDTNEKRVAARDWLIPAVAETIVRRTKPEVVALCEAAGIPFAPVVTVEELFDDPHLNASGGLVEIDLPRAGPTKLPRLPIEMDGHALGVQRQPPRLGEHTREILAGLGLTDAEIADLARRHVVVAADEG
jgi:crotonobetainyl-CoA:carnitine CoA-transferase CaiB-like acyl-CoA transferase